MPAIWSSVRPACPSLVPQRRVGAAPLALDEAEVHSGCRHGQAAGHHGVDHVSGSRTALLMESQPRNPSVTLRAWWGSIPGGCGVVFCCTRSLLCCSDLLSYSGLIKFKKKKPRQNPEAPQQQNHQQRNKWLLFNLFFNVLKLLWKINKTQIL